MKHADDLPAIAVADAFRKGQRRVGRRGIGWHELGQVGAISSIEQTGCESRIMFGVAVKGLREESRMDSGVQPPIRPLGLRYPPYKPD